MSMITMDDWQDKMSDNDILVFGTEEIHDDAISPPPRKHLNFWAISFIALMGILFIFIIGLYCIHPIGNINKNRDNCVVKDTSSIENAKEVIINSEGFSYVVSSDTTVQDIPLHVLTPVGGHVKLLVGSLPYDDQSVILATQAADYRADNGQIVGAFVYKGELLSRGYSKLGFCAIIGDEVTMGLSKETPLFERAVEQSGYFFRQYSLVHDGIRGENTPEGKAIRRALCYDGTKLFIVESRERVSYRDFSQVLIRLGVQEAIALVGCPQTALYVDKQEKRIIADLPHYQGMTESYIVWVKD